MGLIFVSAILLFVSSKMAPVRFPMNGASFNSSHAEFKWIIQTRKRIQDKIGKNEMYVSFNHIDKHTNILIYTYIFI